MSPECKHACADPTVLSATNKVTTATTVQRPVMRPRFIALQQVHAARCQVK